MTATERLRALLDERGVEWKCHGYENHTWWGDWFAETRPSFNGLFVKVEAVLTPEQAIAATLGPGTCHDASIGHYREYGTRFTCSECGATVELLDDQNSPAIRSDGVGMHPRFCPVCGREVVGE